MQSSDNKNQLHFDLSTSKNFSTKFNNQTTPIQDSKRPLPASLVPNKSRDELFIRDKTASQRTIYRNSEINLSKQVNDASVSGGSERKQASVGLYSDHRDTSSGFELSYTLGDWIRLMNDYWDFVIIFGVVLVMTIIFLTFFNGFKTETE